MTTVPALSSTRLRRLATASQGLAPGNTFGNNTAAVLAAIQHIGYVQIDTISVVQRAHHHVLWTRVPAYQPAMLDRLVAERHIFEYWFHAAAYLPMTDFRFALPRMEAIRSGEKHWFKNTSRKHMKAIVERIAAEGPLKARDFLEPASGKSGWWDWKPAKQALEQLFIQGELLVVGREGFQKRYDLMERALPDGIDTRCPSIHEQASHLVATTLRAHGFATRKSMVYLRKGMALRQAVDEVLAKRIEAGCLVEFDLNNGQRVYCQQDVYEVAVNSPATGPGSRIQLLSPFDNLVIQRDRCSAIFGFDYQIECYVPAPKRQHGYFCLPVLYGDKLIGRIDCKAHRKTAQLQVVSLFIDGKSGSSMLLSMQRALKRFARFNDCNEIIITSCYAEKNSSAIKKMLTGAVN